MSFSFFACLSRLKLIRRWSLMRNTVPENDAEHSLQVAMIAHAIAVIARDRYGKQVDPEHVLSLAVYHDATEVMTGDLPTPVKYHNDELRGAYHRLEALSADRLLSLLPEDMQPAFVPYMKQEPGYAHTLVKAADVLMDKGAASVMACATHAVLSGPAYDRINASKLKKVFVTDTIPLRKDADTSKIEVVSMTETFAAVIRKVYYYEPISTEFIF